jgi:hypothetical protein
MLVQNSGKKTRWTLLDQEDRVFLSFTFLAIFISCKKARKKL